MRFQRNYVCPESPADDHCAFDFSFGSDWTREQHEFSGPITGQSKVKLVQFMVSFDSLLKITLYSNETRNHTYISSQANSRVKEGLLSSYITDAKLFDNIYASKSFPSVNLSKYSVESCCGQVILSGQFVVTGISKRSFLFPVSKTVLHAILSQPARNMYPWPHSLICHVLLTQMSTSGPQ